ncbi:PIN domain-containing protein [Micromonospora aurantiaca (nom. illeg.)]|uniref:PIN domain-containing protein n=1 Tax=Micromonospora aurantiaca (nom. illeg.) TaxID=47850 RepID=UPI003EBAC7D4
MRLLPGVTLDRADEVLRTARTDWANAQGGTYGFFHAYIGAVEKTYDQLRMCFAEPDLAGAVRGDAYWHLLTLGPVPVLPAPTEVIRASNEAYKRVISDVIRELDLARAELDALTKLAARPGLPLILDTNVFHTWQRPDQIDWPTVLRGWKETERTARLVVPLRVIDELDRQKYGNGFLAESATKAVRFLQQTLAGRAGESPSIRPNRTATLEVWTQTDDRGPDADLAILRCATDLDVLCAAGARVVTGDLGMRLRAEHMDMQVRALPDDYRKKKDEN